MLRLQGQAQVIQVVKREDNVFKDMISVGRAKNNDIVLPYTSVSKFHAFFRKRGEDGPYTLTDAKSTNRTLVNDAELKPERARELTDGDIISFSRKYVFSFYSPGGFYDFVKKLLQEVAQAELDGITIVEKKGPGPPDR
jgi:pSer/pThr/pTyr-binding forkhead associated (FHA) protein